MAQASRKRKQEKTDTLFDQVQSGIRESAFLLLVGLGAFLVMALLSYSPDDAAWTHTGTNPAPSNHGGVVGAWFADIAYYFCGYLAFLIPLGLAFFGWRLAAAKRWLGPNPEIMLLNVVGIVVTFAAGCGLATLYLGTIVGSGSGGGIFGDFTSTGLQRMFGLSGGRVFLLVLFLAGFTLATGISWLQLIDLIGRLILTTVDALGTTVDWLLGQGRVLSRTQRSIAKDTVKQDKEKPATPSKRGSRKLDGDTEVRHGTKRPRVEPVLVDDDTFDSLSEPNIGPQLDSAIESRIETGFEVDLEPEPEKLAEPVPLRSLPSVSGAAPAPARLPKESSSVRKIPAVVSKLASVLSTGVPAVPPLDLLDPVKKQELGYSTIDLEAMSRQVEKLLADFGVEVNVVAVDPGPVITRFEIDPAPGVKVSQISNLAKDLARGLSVLSVRVVEVIPGKPYIGLEIPNVYRQIVYLTEILDSLPYRNLSSPLTLALGKDIGGKPVVANLGKMPHLLVAGTTGSGKSVAVNAMLLSMLYKATPQEVRLILIDPKMLELSVYEDIPHLLAPVVTDMKEAANSLRWCVAEMERRYRLMAALKVRNITGFNHQVEAAIKAGEPLLDPLQPVDPMAGDLTSQPTLEVLPYIVVVIDELADMMMVVGKKVEELIARLAQKARASGIHLILATQRPSVDVITGLIKANVPTRIAFQVSSKVDSRTILDQMGAENLLGHGDMLYLPPGSGLPQRIHGAFVDDQEVVRVVEYLRQSAEPDYIEDVLTESTDIPEGMAGLLGVEANSSDDSDPLYDQAVRIVTETRKASISSVQRRLKIGYNRAARMVEEMESSGIVGPLESNGSREVLAPPPPEV